MALYYDWVNDPEVRRQSFQTAPIAWEEHYTWFTQKLADPSCFLGVLEAQGLPIGQIRFDLQGDEAVIDYSLDVLVRGRGWAVQLLCLGIDRLRTVSTHFLRADVKRENAASRAVLLQLGFMEKPSPLGAITSRFYLPLSWICQGRW